MGKGSVLVVDDDAAISALIQVALEDEGYQVYTAVNGQAVPVAHALQPDLILLDILMPGMDGVEVSRRLRADPATAPIPIVAMSAHSRLQATAGVMAADDRLPKPFNLDDLYATVDRWIPSC
jgi:CheY-like chemotaxis protein